MRIWHHTFNACGRFSISSRSLDRVRQNKRMNGRNLPGQYSNTINARFRLLDALLRLIYASDPFMEPATGGRDI